MIDRLVMRIPRRWRVPAGIAAAVAALGLLIGTDRLLRAFDQEPLVWLGWILITTGTVFAAQAAVEVVGRHMVATRAAKVTVPDWLEDDWDELCERAGIQPTPTVDQYAGVDGMTTITADEHLREQLLIHPALVDHPRPLVRYTLAVHVARLAADLSTMPATVLYMLGGGLGWLAWMLAGFAAVTGTTGLLLVAAAGALLASGLAELAKSIGQRTYTAADYIAQTYLSQPLTIHLAEAAEASPTWRYARFEPDLTERVSDTGETPPGASLAAAPPRELTTETTVTPWTVINGGER